jgi:hypothetical protein
MLWRVNIKKIPVVQGCGSYENGNCFLLSSRRAWWKVVLTSELFMRSYKKIMSSNGTATWNLSGLITPSFPVI